MIFLFFIVSQRVVYEKKCKEVTSKHCPHVAAPLGSTLLLKKREAEADPQFLYHGLHAAPAAAPIVHAPVTTLVKHACQEITTGE